MKKLKIKLSTKNIERFNISGFFHKIFKKDCDSVRTSSILRGSAWLHNGSTRGFKNFPKIDEKVNFKEQCVKEKLQLFQKFLKIYSNFSEKNWQKIRKIKNYAFLGAGD